MRLIAKVYQQLTTNVQHVFIFSPNPAEMYYFEYFCLVKSPKAKFTFLQNTVCIRASSTHRDRSGMMAVTTLVSVLMLILDSINVWKSKSDLFVLSELYIRVLCIHLQVCDYYFYYIACLNLLLFCSEIVLI